MTEEHPPAPPDDAAIVADPNNPVHRAWLELAGPDTAVHAARALAFFRDCCGVFGPAGGVVKFDELTELQQQEMRARGLASKAGALIGDWAVVFAEATHAGVAATWHAARGNGFATAWRHERARIEFAEAIADLRRSIGLLESLAPQLPPVAGILGALPFLAPLVKMQSAAIPMMQAYARQCDADLLMSHGRLGDYVVLVRGVAAEAQRTADELLGIGSDVPQVNASGAQLRAMADLLLARADAVNELRAARPLYQAPTGDKVFIIHGHAKGEWLELRMLLERELGLAGRVVVLKEEANQGQTVVEKFEAWANQCCYAIALLTPDDTVAPKLAKGDGYAQARPNALFETGWFYGRFGPRRLCIVRQAKTQLPSDLGGVMTADFTTDVKECFLSIQQELRAAGVLGPA